LANIAAFDNTLRLYTTNSQVNEYNFDHMIQLDTSYIQIHAINNDPKTEKVNITDISNLHNTIPLYVGVYIILLKNF